MRLMATDSNTTCDPRQSVTHVRAPMRSEAIYLVLIIIQLNNFNVYYGKAHDYIYMSLPFQVEFELF